MSNMWKLKNQLLLHLNVSCPIKNVHCWVFLTDLRQFSSDVPSGVLRIPLPFSDWLRPPFVCKMQFKFTCCHWLLLVNGLVTGVCSDYLNLLAVCNIIDHSGIFGLFSGPHEYLGLCLSSSIPPFFFHQGRIPKWWQADVFVDLCLWSPETSMEYFGEYWHKEVGYVLFPTLCVSRDLKQTVCHLVCTQCLPNHTEVYREEINVIGAVCFKNFKGFETKLCPVVIVLRQWALYVVLYVRKFLQR